MLSRREILIAATAAGAAAVVRRSTNGLLASAQSETRIDFDVPVGACDCHTHIFGDSRRFAFSAARVYTPGPASVEEMEALHRALHTSRVVIVQPSVYGTDNACMLDALRQIGSRSRGVAVIDDKTPETALDDMDRAGVRGIRINLTTAGQTDPAVGRHRLQSALERIKGRNWHIQMNTGPTVIAALEDLVTAAQVPVVFDHFGGAEGSLGVQQPGFDVLLHLVRMGKAYVKLSAAYRSSTRAPDYPDVVPLARALIAANPQRMLWGSDWPHPDSAPVAGRKVTDIAPRFQIDDGRMLNQLATWAPEPGVRSVILVENPARLYGF